MIKLSVYLVTLNEEKRLPLTLERACQVADELVIIDSGSTDRTEEISRSFNAKFIYNKWESIGHQVSFAEKCCSNKWVLRLDADEVLSDGLIKEILQLKNNPDFDGYRLRIGQMFPGYEEPIRWVKHYQLIRLYNRDAMSMSGRIGFDDVVFTKRKPKIKLLSNFVHHYTHLNIYETVEKRNWETDQQCRRAIIENKNYSPWRMVGTITLNVFKYFILGRYFLYGFDGLIHSVNIGYMRFLKFSKFYEYVQHKKHNLDHPLDKRLEM